jgi:hypothetical protein
MSTKFINTDAKDYFEKRSISYFEGQDESPIIPIAGAVLDALERYVSTKNDVMNVVWETEENLQGIMEFSPQSFRQAMQLVTDVSVYGGEIYEAYPTHKDGTKLLNEPQFNKLAVI